ncbi:MAG: hypothetical protein IKA79_09690 [Lentisphaeria bacterium]|nr:hypothetical protein [Lentisphaeria bacterium]
MKKILVLEGNPAFQKTLTFKKIRYGEVNRASSLHIYTGGKGTNFCRAGRIFRQAEYELLHFTGGENGRKVDHLLAEEGIKTFSVKVDAETRCCITCLNEDDGSMTELIEPSFPLTAEDQKKFLLLLEERLPGCSVAAITGSLPDGTDKEYYTQWAQMVLNAGKLLFIDAVKGIGNTLALPGKKILKINKEELLFLSGGKTLADGMEKLMEKYALEVLAVTDGAGNAFLAASSGVRRKYILPELEKIVSPLGCGDTASSVFCSLLLAGTLPQEAFKTALAAASANCLNGDAASFSMEDMEKLLPLIRMEDMKE